MHTLHVIAVEADEADEAHSQTEAFLEDALIPVTCDYFVIGGGWEAYFDGGTVLCYADSPARFREAVREMLEKRNRTFRRICNRLTGRAVAANEIPDYVFGLAVPDKEAAARLETEENARSALLFHKLLERDSPPVPPEEFPLLGYYLRRLGELVSGYYNIDSRFYDAAEWTVEPQRLWVRCERTPERQWLVAADLHS